MPGVSSSQINALLRTWDKFLKIAAPVCHMGSERKKYLIYKLIRRVKWDSIHKLRTTHSEWTCTAENKLEKSPTFIILTNLIINNFSTVPEPLPQFPTIQTLTWNHVNLLFPTSWGQKQNTLSLYYIGKGKDYLAQWAVSQ